MASIALPASTRDLPSLLDRAGARTRASRIQTLAFVSLIVALAVGLRISYLDATMASSDQVSMAWMVRHCFGFKWIIAHDYGPVLPIVQRGFAQTLSILRMPVDEAAARTPIVLASLLQVAATFGLLRSLRCSRSEAGLGALVCAALPALVCDAHYAWGYGTIWLLTGTICLWAILSYLNEDRPGWLLVGGTALLLHCLSNCFAFALPVTLIYVWISRAQSRPERTIPSHVPHHSPPLARSFIIGFVLPCVAALTIIVLSYAWTGAGQLGRLLFKGEAGSTGLQWDQILELPAMWITHFGYLVAIPTAIGLAWGSRNNRYRPLAVWCWASILPLLFFVDWDRVGYAAEYLMEAAYAGSLLGTVWVCHVYRQLGHRRTLQCAFTCSVALALIHMSVGSADVCLAGGRLTRWTGLGTTWGSVRPETGIKAAGWYVQSHVPASAIVMTTHTNTGMESPVAEYYCGRAVLADWDLLPGMIEPLVREMVPDVDVLIAEPEWRRLAESLSDFERTATFRHAGRPVRYVYARRSLQLPQVDAEANALNDRFDRECVCRKAPQPLAAPPGFDAVYARYVPLVRDLRTRLAEKAH